MKVRFIRQGDGPNPLFNAEDKLRVERAGGIYPHHHSRQIPVGTIEEGPDAWILCGPQYGNEPAFCEPVDDEAKARVALYLAEVEGRKEWLREAAAAADPATAYGRHLIDMAQRYGVWEGPDDEAEADEHAAD